ncbi:UNVERIFIED_CONTAM: Elongation factor P [Sesamum indicum]
MRLLLAKRISAALRSPAPASSSIPRNPTTSSRHIKFHAPRGALLDSPWSATQLRRARFSGADVIKAQHTSQGRGGAIIQVELRDVDSGSKVNERLRTDEPVQKIYVQEKSFTYLYTDDETGNIVLMEPKTYSQLEVPRHLFGESLVYLQDDMEVTVQLYDERPLSVKIPHRVTCTVTEAADSLRGSGPTAYKKVLLDNGLTVQVPAHILAGDKIVINTTDNSYASRQFEKLMRCYFSVSRFFKMGSRCRRLDVVSVCLMCKKIVTEFMRLGRETEAQKPDDIDSMNQTTPLLLEPISVTSCSSSTALLPLSGRRILNMMVAVRVEVTINVMKRLSKLSFWEASQKMLLPVAVVSNAVLVMRRLAYFLEMG